MESELGQELLTACETRVSALFPSAGEPAKSDLASDARRFLVVVPVANESEGVSIAAGVSGWTTGSGRRRTAHSAWRPHDRRYEAHGDGCQGRNLNEVIKDSCFILPYPSAL